MGCRWQLCKLFTTPGEDSRQSSFGHLDARTVQVFLQATIQFGQPAIFKICHALFFILDVAARAEFVGRHLGIG